MGTRESIPAPLRLSLSGPAAAHEAVLATRAFADGAGVHPEGAARLAIVVEELVTNLYDHGGLRAEDAFSLELQFTGDSIDVVVTDPGKPFDPPAPDPDGAIPSRGGGAGLKLTRAWADRMDYQTKGGLNRLHLTLPLSRK